MYFSTLSIILIIAAVVIMGVALYIALVDKKSGAKGKEDKSQTINIGSGDVFKKISINTDTNGTNVNLFYEPDDDEYPEIAEPYYPEEPEPQWEDPREEEWGKAIQEWQNAEGEEEVMRTMLNLMDNFGMVFYHQDKSIVPRAELADRLDKCTAIKADSTPKLSIEGSEEEGKRKEKAEATEGQPSEARLGIGSEDDDDEPDVFLTPEDDPDSEENLAKVRRLREATQRLEDMAAKSKKVNKDNKEE